MPLLYEQVAKRIANILDHANRVVSVLIVGQTMDWHRLKLYVDAVVFRRYEEEKS